MLAAAAGTTFGLTAALMKAMTGTFAGGVGHLLTDWPVCAMVESAGEESARGPLRPRRVRSEAGT